MTFKEGTEVTKSEITADIAESKDEPPRSRSGRQLEVAVDDSSKQCEPAADTAVDEQPTLTESPAEKMTDPMKETPAEAEERAFKLRDEIRALVAERYQIRDSLKKTISSLRMEERQRRLMDLGSEPAVATERSKKPGSTPPDPSGIIETGPEPAVSDAKEQSMVEDSKDEGAKSPEAPLSGQKRSRSKIEEAESEASADPVAKEGESNTDLAADATPESQTDDRSAEKRPRIEIDDRTKKRSKNLFGHLMGHLQKAKEHLEREKDTKQAERQQETELRVKEKIEKEKRTQSEVKIQALKDLELELMDRLKKIQSEIEAKELAALVCHLESHYKSMQNFIRTKSDPTIFWKPKIPCPATDVLQRETALEIESKIRSISKNLQPAS